MPRYIAFLRAINVGGRTVRMESLCSLFREMGFTAVESFIASGNIIFDSSIRSRLKIAQAIERSLAESLGYEVHTFIRTPEEVAVIAAAQPFPAKLMAQAAAMNVGLLAEPLTAVQKRKLMELQTGIDEFHTAGTEVYWLCRKKQSESKFSNAVFERTLNTRATFRSMSTMQRLALKLG